MSEWIPKIVINEARGLTAPPAPIDAAAVIIGCASAGTQSALGLTQNNTPALVAASGYGPGVDAAATVIDADALTVALYTTPATTPGSYGTIDLSGFTGTALPLPDASSLPLNNHEVYIRFVVGTPTIGTTGATYVWSTNDGRDVSAVTALGTDDFILLPHTGAKILLEPGAGDLTALNTLINEEKTKLAAHVVLVAGTVHSNADNNASVIAMNATASATTTATRIARVNAVKAAYNAHRVLGSGASPAIHINVPGDAVNVVAVADAIDDESALALALDIKAKLNAHEASVVFHTIADGTNTITSPAPVAGSIVAGDIIRVKTIAPKWAVADIDTAATKLAQSSYDFSMIYVSGSCSASEAGHVSTMLNTLAALGGKRCTAVIHTRGPNVGETETDWAASIEADFLAFNDDRITIIEGHPTWFLSPTDGRILNRSWAPMFFARSLAVTRRTWPGSPNDNGLANVFLYDSAGNLVGHDEGPSGNVTGLGDAVGQGNRFTCLIRGPFPQVRNQVFTTVPWVQWTTGGRIFQLPQRRIANAIERAGNAVSFPQLGGTAFYDTDPNTLVSTLTTESQNAIHTTIFDGLGADFNEDIENYGDDDPVTGLVQVASVITVANGIAVIGFTIAPRLGALIVRMNFTYAAQ
jgi:hypothetical protein